MAHFLVLLNEPIGEQLLDEVAGLAEDPQFYVVVPASDPGDDDVLTWLEQSTGDLRDPGVIYAEHQLHIALRALRDAGHRAYGDIGPADPIEAVCDVISQGWRFDGIVVSTPHAGVSRWLNLDLPSKLDREVVVPVVATVIDDAPLAPV